MSYDQDNIFAKILRGDIPSKKIYEDEHVLVIHDAFPQAPIHALVLPKGAYMSMSDFSSHASDAEIIAMNRAVASVIKALDIEQDGYRLVSNTGKHGGQEIPHLHWHILAGEDIGPMRPKQD